MKLSNLSDLTQQYLRDVLDNRECGLNQALRKAEFRAACEVLRDAKETVDLNRKIDKALQILEVLVRRM